MTLLSFTRGLCLLAALACVAQFIYSTLQTNQAQHAHLLGIARDHEGKDPIEASDRVVGRFRSLLQGQSTVGFACSRNLESSPSADRGFSVTQYALTPVKLEPDSTLAWVVTRFNSQQELVEFAGKNRYQITANPLPGLALLHRSGDAP